MSAGLPLPLRLTATPTLPAEEAARADLYALLSRLFYSGPDAALMRSIAHSGNAYGGPSSALGRAWSQVVQAAATVSAEAACAEYDQTYVGLGQARVSIYGSHYLSENWKEHTLVNLRDELDDLGLSRKRGVSEPEDHLSGLLDVMNNLLRRGTTEPQVAVQHGFFSSYIAPWYTQFCDATVACDGLDFYRPATGLLRAFMLFEAEFFSLE